MKTGRGKLKLQSLQQQHEIEFDLTIVPANYKEKDPRQLAYNFPNFIRDTEQGLVIYNKYVQKFIYFQGVEAAETVAKMFGCILVPTRCIHWRRTKLFTDRRVAVGREAFYIVKKHELIKNEIDRLKEYIEEMRDKYDCKH